LLDGRLEGNMDRATNELRAGAAVVDITPDGSPFLWGYPHVKRYATGVHDRLLTSALYLCDGATEVLFLANDIGLVGKSTARRARERLSAITTIPLQHIMVTATHTHSGPVTVDLLSSSTDPSVPKADPEYLQHWEDAMVAAGLQACRGSVPAAVGLVVADGPGLGTNRRKPTGPADPQVPVLLVKTADGERYIAAMLVGCVHPTVLHEDSTLLSGDFPAMARAYLWEHLLGLECPVLYHTGPAGDQSPRHVVRANTVQEARRLGSLLGQAVERVVPQAEYTSSVPLQVRSDSVPLPPRGLPPVADAQAVVQRAAEHLRATRAANTSRGESRTAECDWFGAQQTLALSEAAESGRLAAARDTCMPAEIQVIVVGPWRFVGWPGEVFVDYGLAIKRRHADAYVISLANGELQGYIVTVEAAREGGYEASNAVFAPQSGEALVEKTTRLLQSLD